MHVYVKKRHDIQPVDMVHMSAWMMDNYDDLLYFTVAYLSLYMHGIHEKYSYFCEHSQKGIIFIVLIANYYHHTFLCNALHP